MNKKEIDFWKELHSMGFVWGIYMIIDILFDKLKPNEYYKLEPLERLSMRISYINNIINTHI